MLISKDPAVQQQQLALVPNAPGIQGVMLLLQGMDPMLRLPVLQRAFPALRRSTVPQRKALAKLVPALIHADARVDVFEFCMAKLLETLLNDQLSAAVPHGTVSLESEVEDIALLFTVAAQIGAQDQQAARTAYDVGMSLVLASRSPPYAPVSDWQKRLSEALPRLEELHPLAKKTVIEGLVRTVANDEMLMDEEAELLRTVCALLHCPLPPILPVIAGDSAPADG